MIVMKIMELRVTDMKMVIVKVKVVKLKVKMVKLKVNILQQWMVMRMTLTVTLLTTIIV